MKKELMYTFHGIAFVAPSVKRKVNVTQKEKRLKLNILSYDWHSVTTVGFEKEFMETFHGTAMEPPMSLLLKIESWLKLNICSYGWNLLTKIGMKK